MRKKYHFMRNDSMIIIYQAHFYRTYYIISEANTWGLNIDKLRFVGINNVREIVFFGVSVFIFCAKNYYCVLIKENINVNKIKDELLVIFSSPYMSICFCGFYTGTFDGDFRRQPV